MKNVGNKNEITKVFRDKKKKKEPGGTKRPKSP